MADAIEHNKLMELQSFQTLSGIPILQIPLEVFPGMQGFAYLTVVDGDYILIDTGSGFGNSDEQLESGLKEAGRMITGKELGFEDLTYILITHGHIDHFGGLASIKPKTKAKIGVHELDRRNITNYEERITVVARRLGEFLTEAGVPAERRDKTLEIYLINKALFKSVPVDFTYESIGMKLGRLEFLHVPGHCAGHVVIRLDDFLFSGDHVLEGISPHQSPERLTLSTGLDHYLHSLAKLDAWAEGVRVVVGGHRQPIYNLNKRIEEIREVHKNRLNQVLAYFQTPGTIFEVSKHLFGDVHGYNILLALEEAGAHVEYLYQRGLLEIADLGEQVVRYRASEQ
ncbi:MAG: MBL fold metallo-hydrolase [Chloroflexi bacterium]|nr:MAG: MBL fold metallo-hydrolase [Chloroflexota bacterium]